MKIEFEGQVYDFDLDDLDVKQGVKIEKHIGGTLIDWEKGLENASVPCFQALGWMILHGGDVSVPIDGVNFKVMKLARAWSEAMVREGAPAAADEPDPTTPAGASTPPTPGSTPSATGLPGSTGPRPGSSTASGPTG